MRYFLCYGIWWVPIAYQCHRMLATAYRLHSIHPLCRQHLSRHWHHQHPTKCRCHRSSPVISLPRLGDCISALAMDAPLVCDQGSRNKISTVPQDKITRCVQGCTSVPISTCGRDDSATVLSPPPELSRRMTQSLAGTVGIGGIGVGLGNRLKQQSLLPSPSKPCPAGPGQRWRPPW